MTRFRYSKLLTFLVASSVLLSACRGAATSPAVDLSAQITQTMQAVAMDAQSTLQAAVPTAAPATDAPQPTDTPPPTATLEPTQALLPTEALAADVTATVTPFPVAPISGTLARITTNTNCRTGPSTAFPIVFTAMEGTTLKVVSSSTDSNYVVVENPNSPGQTCWLWTQYVEFSGSLAGLPVATLPVLPTPEMSFTLTFITVVECTNWSLAFKIVNTGGTTLQSYKIVAQDLNEHTQQTTTRNDFNERQACKDTELIPLLERNDTGFIYADDFTFDPSGHQMKATVTVCSNNDLSSKCWTQVVSFKP